MENQERLKQAGVLGPHGELTPELSAAIESLTPDEVDDLIARGEGLAAASADEQGGGGRPDKEKEKDEDEDERPGIDCHPAIPDRPGKDRDEDDDDDARPRIEAHVG